MSIPNPPLTELSAEARRELLRQLLERKARQSRSYPLSLAQQRLWILAELDPSDPAYNLLHSLRLRGQLDVHALGRALAAMVARHEALRTRFETVEGEPRQRVEAPPRVVVSFVDLRRLVEANRGRLCRQRAVDLARRPYDLQRGPAFRFVLVQLDEKDHVLLLAMHHIVGDIWSFRVIHRELEALYVSFATGGAAAPAPLKLQYGEYTLWERESERESALAGKLDYWREVLRDLQPSELATDRPRPEVQTSNARAITLPLSAALNSELRRVSAELAASPFVVALAAFFVLLGRATGACDVSCGTPIANRNRTEAEDLIGFFVNTLVLRGRLHENPSFRALVARVRNTVVDGYSHSEVPFERIVQALGIARDLSRGPLYQIAFQNTRVEMPVLPGLEVETYATLEYGVVRSDLEVYLIESEQEPRLLLLYNTDLYDATTAQSFLHHYRNLLASATADPDRAVASLSCLSAAERQQLVGDWNDTDVALPRDGVLPRLFTAVADRAPDRIAFENGDGQWSYGALDDRTTVVASALRALGVRLETPVGLCLPRSTELLVLCLAVLKAGGFYVPLDPRQPETRIAALLQELRIETWFVPSAPDTAAASTAQLQPAPRRLAELDLEAPRELETDLEPHHLAYAIFTSGSTGRPKATLVPHGAVVRLVHRVAYAPLGNEDRVVHVSNVAFDAATWEIWGAWLNGGRLIALSSETALAAEELAAALEERLASALFLTTALFNRIADDRPSAFAGLRFLLFGGEAVDPERVAGVLRDAAPRRLLHVYGPTETTTFASAHHVERVSSSARTVPIGLPITNTRILVLDRWLELVPARYPGELMIGGPGLARGYHGRPALTAQRFVPNPFSGAPGDRLYRSGDLVRRRFDGAIEFLGRTDHQVKIRGFRIEMGEIEAALLSHPDVRAAVVGIWEPRAGDRRLAAYVVLAAETADVAALRRHLAAKLPEYMIPAAFVPLTALPLTPSGKVDRKLLPTPESSATGQAPRVLPTAGREQEIARLWCELLVIDQVGAEDNFFERGGNSLLMVQLRQSLQRQFGRTLSMVDMFRHPTVRSMAGFLGSEEPTTAPIEAGTRRAELRLAASARRQRLQERDSLP